MIDSFIYDPGHAAHSSTRPRYRVTSVLTDLATQHSIQTSTKNMLFADSHLQRRADLATCGELFCLKQPGRVSTLAQALCLSWISSWGRRIHLLAPVQTTKRRPHEPSQRSKCLSANHDQGLAFAPLVSYTIASGRPGLDLLRRVLCWGAC